MEKEKTYGVWAVRSAASIFGRAESWCKEAGRPLEFASQETAEAYAKECNSRTTANVHYFVKEKEPEPAYMLYIQLMDSIFIRVRPGKTGSFIFVQKNFWHG